ncbi:MAG TPA: VWA domain-containing protein [Candidatus Binataceae bacterium]|nr:VWA domain-containing protein [Candidatus Binataceae bacterium]
MSTLRDRLLTFIDELRRAEIRISVAESIDAMNAVVAAGLDRIAMREALAASLIKDEADRAAFDSAFDSYFGAPPRPRGTHPDQSGQTVSAASGRGRPGENPVSIEPQSKPRPEQGRQRGERESESHKAGGEAAHKEGAGDGEAPRQNEQSQQGVESRDDRHEDSGIEAARAAQLRALERMPFERYTVVEYDAAREALAPLVRRFRIRLGRRLRTARAGRIDLRRTIRAATQRGGLLIDLKHRSRRPRHVDLVILADVSGSVRYAAELLLELMAGARGCFHRVRSFVYVDRLCEATFESGHLLMEPAPDLYARSDFGRVLVELWDRRAGILTRSTLVVVMGDARNNRRPARVDLLAEIARACRGVVWLNPEELARWGTGDSAITQYARVVDDVVAVRNLRELQRALLRVA